jgi:hypothetical protein
LTEILDPVESDQKRKSPIGERQSNSQSEAQDSIATLALRLPG